MWPQAEESKLITPNNIILCFKHVTKTYTVQSDMIIVGILHCSKRSCHTVVNGPT